MSPPAIRDRRNVSPAHRGGLDLSFTNSSLFMAVTVVAASGFLWVATSGRGQIPTRTQSVAEMA